MKNLVNKGDVLEFVGLNDSRTGFGERVSTSYVKLPLSYSDFNCKRFMHELSTLSRIWRSVINCHIHLKF